MIVSCPRCETAFSLPDEAYRVGRKVRCSQCGNVFLLPELPVADLPLPPPSPSRPAKEKKATPKKSPKLLIIMFVALFISLGGLGYAGYILYHYISTPSAPVEASPTAGMSAEERRKYEEHEARLKQIVLEDIRQFVVKNDKLGNIVVVQGRAVNKSTEPKDLITVEARLLDANNTLLASHQQLAGVTLSLFQLQVLGEKELAEALNNKIEILTNNTNVLPGSQVPFVIVFSAMPKNLAWFEVRPVDVKESVPPR